MSHRLRGHRLGQIDARELRARGDVELRVNLAQVVVDRARAEEQLRGNLWIGLAAGDQAGDLQLLGVS